MRGPHGSFDAGRPLGGGTSFDFDPSPDRLRAKGATKWHHVPSDVVPAWLAETDFDLCPAIVDAVQAALGRGDLGYPDWPAEPLAEAFAARMADRHGWRPEVAHVRHVCDLVQAVQVVVGLASATGDFGPGGEGYIRLNFGTGRRVLDEIVDRMAASLRHAVRPG